MKLKNKPLKKILSSILAAAMVVGLFSFENNATIYAEEDPYVELTNTLTAH